MQESVLDVVSLTKSYSGKRAVEDLSFRVKPGEIVGLLGPNGAGKTTSINIILGVLQPSSGEVHIDGWNLATHRTEALGRTNFAAVYAPLPGNLTVRQNLEVFARLYSVKHRKDRIEQMLAEFDLYGFANTKCGLLSSGEQTRVSLAKAMLNNPRLLLLDEPTASLDPSTASDIRKRITGFAKQGHGVLWTSHNMYEVEETCDRVIFISRGKMLLEGNPRTLPGEHGKATLEELFITVAREPLSLEGA